MRDTLLTLSSVLPVWSVDVKSVAVLAEVAEPFIDLGEEGANEAAIFEGGSAALAGVEDLAFVAVRAPGAIVEDAALEQL